MYAVALRLQADLIEKLCFKECGKAIVGNIYDPMIGDLMPCNEENCPFVDRIYEGFGAVGDQNIILRKLKDTREEMLMKGRVAL